MERAKGDDSVRIMNKVKERAQGAAASFSAGMVSPDMCSQNKHMQVGNNFFL